MCSKSFLGLRFQFLEPCDWCSRIRGVVRLEWEGLFAYRKVRACPYDARFWNAVSPQTSSLIYIGRSNELSRVVRVGDEHIVCVYNHDDDFSVLLLLQTSYPVKVNGCISYHVDALFVSCFDILGVVLMHPSAEGLRAYGSGLVVLLD